MPPTAYRIRAARETFRVELVRLPMPEEISRIVMMMAFAKTGSARKYEKRWIRYTSAIM